MTGKKLSSRALTPVFGSLSWRVLFILVCGILLIQIISFGIIFLYKDEQIRTKMFSFMGSDIAMIHRLLSPFSPNERQEWQPYINRGFYTMSPADHDPTKPNVEIGELPLLDGVAAQVSKEIGRKDVRWFWEINGGRSKPILEVPFDDVHALLVDAEDPLPPPPTTALLAYLLALLLVASVLGWLAMNIAMRPLFRLSEAARQIGNGIQSRPIDESGPLEVRHTAHALNTMRTQILRQLDERTQILAAISHDLQTPITRLRLRAELISDRAVRKATISDLDEMSGLIIEGIQYAKSGHVQAERVPIDLNALAASIAAEMSDLGQQVRIHGRIEGSYTGVFHAVRRSIQNVVDNAVKFGGCADIFLEQDEEFTVVRVIDKGPGLDESMLEKVFCPFFRAEPSRGRKCGGSGLGLAIARNFVRAHGGDIILRTLQAGGLEAEISLRRS